MATRTIAVGGGNWNTSSTWVEVAVPTAADDVVALANGLSGNVTIDGVAGTPSLCRSADFTNYAGTLTHASAKELDVGDGTTGNFKLVAGMTYVPNAASILKFVSTTTGNSITTAGKSMGPVEFNGAGGAWSLADAYSSARDLTFTSGTVTATSTIAQRNIIVQGGTLNLGGNVTSTGNIQVSSGTLSGASFAATGVTSTTLSGGTCTLLGITFNAGAFGNSGCTTTIGATGIVSATSATISAGSVTLSGPLTTTTGGLGVTTTGNLDATSQTLTIFSTLSMSSSGLLKAANMSIGTTLSFTGGTTTITGNVSGTTLSITGGTARTINMGSGTWTMSGTGNVLNATTVTNLTLNATSSTLAFTDTSASTKAFIGGGKTYGNVIVSGAASAGTFTISGANTFGTLTFNADSNIVLTSAVTQTVTSFVATGTSGHNVIIAASTPASAATLSQSSGTVSCNFLTLQDNRTAGGAAWYAGANSTNTSGNTGWIFANKPTSGQSFVSGGF